MGHLQHVIGKLVIFDLENLMLERLYAFETLADAGQYLHSDQTRQ